MNKYKLSKAGIDANSGIKRFNDDAELYERFLYTFPEDTNYAQLCKAIAQKDAQLAFQAGHALKGIAGNLSLTQLYEDIAPMVEILRKDSMDGVDEMFAAVVKDYETILEILTQE